MPNRSGKTGLSFGRSGSSDAGFVSEDKGTCAVGKRDVAVEGRNTSLGEVFQGAIKRCCV